MAAVTIFSLVIGKSCVTLRSFNRKSDCLLFLNSLSLASLLTTGRQTDKSYLQRQSSGIANSKENMMAKVLVLYYSAYGHIETMAYAVAEGAKSAGADVTVKRVPELVPADVAKASYFKVDQAAEIATPDELANYDAIIFGAGTRFGTVASQMRNFVDQTGGLWMKGALVGKVGSVFTSSATQHGGQESTILGFIPTLMHQGMVVVGLPYAFQGQMGLEEIKGGSPYGASTITGGDGSRQPSEIELEAARYQGAHVAKIAAKLSA
jgi:NAD(P)H dehydrogenase (quinone)